MKTRYKFQRKAKDINEWLDSLPIPDEDQKKIAHYNWQRIKLNHELLKINL
ncbi:MAG TPA: hypothetical protein VJ945_06215 [Flavobacteriaceae bacterium]|nr:hypothetical protein [Flavobacteriaceae bacterium]